MLLVFESALKQAMHLEALPKEGSVKKAKKRKEREKKD